MSLNWKEIDLVLSELDLVGAKIERIIQPSFDALCLGLFKPGKKTELLISIAQGACRIHALSAAPPKPNRPLRFMECLRSRIRGGRIESVRQIDDERIVRFDISVMRSEEGEAEADAAEVASGREPASLRHYRLYARLWSGAGNLVLVDEAGIVVDALARRPKRGEVSGEPCLIEEEFDSPASKPGASRKVERIFEIRSLPGDGSFNERVEAYYSERGGELSRERLIESAREKFRKRSLVLGVHIAELEKRSEEFRDAERQKELADILMASAGLAYEGKYLACDDFYRGGSVRIPVDPRLSVVENATSYYAKYHKAKSGLADVEIELASAKKSLREAEEELSGLEAMDDPFRIARAMAKGGTMRTGEKKSFPGLSLEREGWTILVGRSAKENDELLRRHVRGSDTWLHARDWAGSYVFIKARTGKTVPLDILLDAGNLAIYYSKGRSNGGGDVYYTFAKYLRRAKDGPKGLVIPTQERNLSIKLDETRLRELRNLLGPEETS